MPMPQAIALSARFDIKEKKDKAIPFIERFRTRFSRFFAIALFIFVFCSESAWEGTIVSWLLFACGCFLVAIASVGRLWCSVYIAGYKMDVLITEGPYSMCRHPLYFFSFLGAIGVGLATETFFITFILLFAFAAYYPYIIQNEETRLLKMHSDAYKCYRDATPAFFPRPSLLREPETYMVHTKTYRKHIFEALWFMWLVGIMELIEAIHELTILPAVFKLH